VSIKKIDERERAKKIKKKKEKEEKTTGDSGAEKKKKKNGVPLFLPLHDLFRGIQHRDSFPCCVAMWSYLYMQ
jgi:hypothetical protein